MDGSLAFCFFFTFASHQYPSFFKGNDRSWAVTQSIVSAMDSVWVSSGFNITYPPLAVCCLCWSWHVA